MKNLTKKKKIALAGLIVFGITTLAISVFFLITALTRGANSSLASGELLVKIHKWQQQENPGVIWQFEADGTGSITTNNNLESFPMNWGFDGDILAIKTQWQIDLEDEFEFESDAAASSFTVTSKSDQKVSTFIPLPESTEE